MEQFSRECLEIDMEDQPQDGVLEDPGLSSSHASPPHPASFESEPQTRSVARSLSQSLMDSLPPDENSRSRAAHASSSAYLTTSMDKVYSRAARLIQRTLDVEDVIVMDVSHCEMYDASSNLSSSPAMDSSSRKPTSDVAAPVTLYFGNPAQEPQMRTLSSEEYDRLREFFGKFPDGRVLEGVVPLSFRAFIPTRMKYALSELVAPIFLRTIELFSAVPVFNIDKRPFALLCAYNATDHTKRFVSASFDTPNAI